MGMGGNGNVESHSRTSPVGSEFQAATANEPSGKCVLVRRTVKSPPTNDRRRWSLHRLHESVKYPGAVHVNVYGVYTSHCEVLDFPLSLSISLFITCHRNSLEQKAGLSVLG